MKWRPARVKTYVYLRTILNLYQLYGFKKFIIVVPSIAIRKGVEIAITMLKDHLKTIYNMDITKHIFVYDSSSTYIKGFLERRDLDICIMNMQAFATNRTKIKNADESGQIIWDELKQIKPVVILDKPQRIAENSHTKRTLKIATADEFFGPVRRISSLETICYEDYFFGPCALKRLLNKTVTVLKNYVFK